MNKSSKITASELVLSAIFFLQRKNGVTAKDITKFICEKRGCRQSQVRSEVKRALERATENGIFSKKRGLYRIESGFGRNKISIKVKGSGKQKRMKRIKPSHSRRRTDEDMGEAVNASTFEASMSTPQKYYLGRACHSKHDHANAIILSEHLANKSSRKKMSVEQIKCAMTIYDHKKVDDDDDDDEDFFEDEDEEDDIDYFSDDQMPNRDPPPKANPINEQEQPDYEPEPQERKRETKRKAQSRSKSRTKGRPKKRKLSKPRKKSLKRKRGGGRKPQRKARVSENLPRDAQTKEEKVEFEDQEGEEDEENMEVESKENVEAQQEDESGNENDGSGEENYYDDEEYDENNEQDIENGEDYLSEEEYLLLQQQKKEGKEGNDDKGVKEEERTQDKTLAPVSEQGKGDGKGTSESAPATPVPEVTKKTDPSTNEQTNDVKKSKRTRSSSLFRKFKKKAESKSGGDRKKPKSRV